MKIVRYMFMGLVATLPRLWIDDYTIRSPIFWTVIVVGNLGLMIGALEKLCERDTHDT